MIDVQHSVTAFRLSGEMYCYNEEEVLMASQVRVVPKSDAAMARECPLSAHYPHLLPDLLKAMVNRYRDQSDSSRALTKMTLNAFAGLSPRFRSIQRFVDRSYLSNL